MNGIECELIYLEKQNLYTFENLELRILSPNKRHLERLHKYWIEDQKSRAKKEKKGVSNTIEMSDSIETLYKNRFENDTRRANKSSIAFNLKYNEQNYLFLGDANISTVTKSIKKDHKIERLYAQLVKLSHHGSRKNINQKFLDIVSSHKFIVSTNGATHNHPDKEALSRIIKNPKRDGGEIEFLFNYEEDDYSNSFTFSDDELENREYNFKLVFAEYKGIKL